MKTRKGKLEERKERNKDPKENLEWEDKVLKVVLVLFWPTLVLWVLAAAAKIAIDILMLIYIK